MTDGESGTADLARALADEHGAGLLALTQMVTRDAVAAQDALVDAVVAAAGRGGRPPDPARPPPWLRAMALVECRRQLRARGQFAATRLPVSPAADPMDALSPADREALALAHAEAGRPDDRGALRRWREATVGLVLVRIADPGCPGRREIIGGAAVEDGGMLTPRRLAALARHREVCHACTDATTPELAALEDRPVIPAAADVDDALLARVGAAAADAERVAHLVERAGPYAADGFPVPWRDADPAVWLRRAVVLGALGAVLLMVGLAVAVLVGSR